MTDDIVTRSQQHGTYHDKTGTDAEYVEHLESEIERLRNAIIRIEKAITDEGKVPSYHRATMKRHRKEWETLHTAIDEAIKAVHRG